MLSAANLLSSIYRLWREDHLSRLTLFAAGILVGLYLSPLPDTFKLNLTANIAPLVFLSLAVGAILLRLSQLPEVTERRFWKDLATAYILWLLNVGFQQFFDPATNLTAELIRDSLYSLHYLVLVLAIERRPHRVQGGPIEGLSRSLSWPSVAAFVLGLLLYFVFIPVRQNPEAYASGLPSFFLFIFLDLYLVINLGYLALTTSSHRWTRIYGALACVQALVGFSDIAELNIYLGGGTWPVELDFLWVLSFIVLVLAARYRHLLPKDVCSPTPVSLPGDGLSGPSGRTMVTALAFPMAHFTLYGAGFLDVGSRLIREQLVLVWLLLLGAIAFFQSRLLDRRTSSLATEKVQFENTLKKSQEDLRLMVERLHSQDLLQESELKFSRAFRASPDVMVVSSFEEGRLIDVNSAFESTVGFSRKEAIGQTSQDLRLWARPRDRDQMLHLLATEGQISNHPAVFRIKSGTCGLSFLSAEIITVETTKVVLSVFHDLTFQVGKGDKPPDALFSLLDQAQDAMILLDAEDRVCYWNTGAEQLMFLKGKKALGKTTDQIWEVIKNKAEITRTLENQECWAGRVSFKSPNTSPTTLETWWSQSRKGSPQQTLILAYPPDDSPNNA